MKEPYERTRAVKAREWKTGEWADQPPVTSARDCSTRTCSLAMVVRLLNAPVWPPPAQVTVHPIVALTV